MVKIITPSLGGRLDYNDAYQPTPAPGTIFHADDSHHYILARASAAGAANTQVILTEPAFTVAPGAGDWTSQGFAVPAGNFAWFRRRPAAGG